MDWDLGPSEQANRRAQSLMLESRSRCDTAGVFYPVSSVIPSSKHDSKFQDRAIVDKCHRLGVQPPSTGSNQLAVSFTSLGLARNHQSVTSSCAALRLMRWMGLLLNNLSNGQLSKPFRTDASNDPC